MLNMNNNSFIKYLSNSHFLVIGLLGVMTYIFHSSALSAYWRFDDGEHLLFVAKYTPWEYFFIPEITGLQSQYKFVTPWNTFFYDISLGLFGLNPQGFYLHQLFMLWITSAATYYFLKLWCPGSWALLGSILFLAGSPAVHIAQELMAGHYLAGLLFSILALYFFVISLRNQDKKLLFLSVIFYLLATTCKEIYVPLIGILIFIPENKLSNRLLFSIPFFLIALFYILWRKSVLGGNYIGGYPLHKAFKIDLDRLWGVFDNFFQMPQWVLGNHFAAQLILIFLVVVLFYYFLNSNKLTILALLIASVLLLIFPLIPVSNSINEIDRKMFLPWWAFSIYCAILFSKLPEYKYVLYSTSFILIILAGFNSYNELTDSNKSKLWKHHDEVSKFIMGSNSDQLLYAPDVGIYPSSIITVSLLEAEKLIQPDAAPHANIVTHVHQLDNLPVNFSEIYGYNSSCQCISSVSRETLEEEKKKLRNKQLSVRIDYKDHHSSWELGPYQQGRYSLHVNFDEEIDNNFRILSLPRKARLKISREKLRAMNFYLYYESPEGWSILSDLLRYDPEQSLILDWSS